MVTETKHKSVTYLLQEDTSICENTLLYCEDRNVFKNRLMKDHDLTALATYKQIISVKLKSEKEFDPLLSLKDVLFLLNNIDTKNIAAFYKVLDIFALTLKCSSTDTNALMLDIPLVVCDDCEKYYYIMLVLTRSVLDQYNVDSMEQPIKVYVERLSSILKEKTGRLYYIAVESLKLLMSEGALDPFDYLTNILQDIKGQSIENFAAILCDFIDEIFVINENSFSKVVDFLQNLNLIQILESSARKVIEPEIEMKYCFFLLRKLIEYFKKINQSFESDLIQWDPTLSKEYSEAWDVFFTIVENLKENQQHLILPAFKMLDKINVLNKRWTICLIERGLQNNNGLVQAWCVEYILKERDLWEHLGDGSESCFTTTMNKGNTISIGRINLELYYDFVKDKPEFVLLENLQKSVPVYHTSMALLDMIDEKNPNEELQINCLNKIIGALIYCHNQLIRVSIIDRILMSIFENHRFELFLKLNNLVLLEPNSGTLKKLIGLYHSYNISFGLLKSIHETSLPIKLKTYLHTENEDYIIHQDECLTNSLIFVHAFIYYTANQGMQKCCEKILDFYIESFNREESTKTYILAAEELMSGYTVKFLDKIEQLNKLCILKVTSPVSSIQIKTESARILKAISLNCIHDTSISIKSSHIFLVNSLSLLIQNHGSHNADGSGELYSQFYLCLSFVRLNVLRKLKKEEIKPMEEFELTMDLLEIGGTRILATEMKSIEVILKAFIGPKTESSWEIFQKASSMIRRLYSELITYKKFEYFWECLDNFMDLLFANGVENDDWTSNIILPYCEELLEISVSTRGLANVVFQKLLIANHSKKLSTMKEFLPIFITGLLFGDSQTREKRCEANLSEEIIKKSPELQTRYKYNADAEVRTMCLVAFTILSNDFITQLFDPLIAKFYEITSGCYFIESKAHFQKLRVAQALYFEVIYLPDISKTKMECLRKAVFFENHQPNVLYTLEIIFARMINLNNFEQILLNDDFIKSLRRSGLQSWFIVIYYAVSWKQICTEENLMKLVKTLLPFTMAQHFTTRLYAQVTIKKVIECCDEKSTNESQFLALVENYITRHFTLHKEKHSERYIDDFRFALKWYNPVNEVVHHIPRITGMTNDEFITTDMLNTCFKIIINDDFSYKSSIYLKDFPVILKPFKMDSDSLIDEPTTNVQSKIIPMKEQSPKANLFDLYPLKYKEQKSHRSDLIVVASLLTKFPNLGGLARTCEIFNVDQYAINSLHYTEHNEFKNLSVGAETWLNFLEVPVKNLTEYLDHLKQKGYTIVGAEQTPNSTPISAFNFPKKTVLLLGNEKEGIPANLLSKLDHAIEIPQFGLVRSLNVHVCASLFIWEYARQHQVKN